VAARRIIASAPGKLELASPLSAAECVDRAARRSERRLTAACATEGPREPGAAAREDTQLADACHGARACDSGHARPNGVEQDGRGADGVARTTRMERAACAVATSGNV